MRSGDCRNPENLAPCQGFVFVFSLANKPKMMGLDQQCVYLEQIVQKSSCFANSCVMTTHLNLPRPWLQLNSMRVNCGGRNTSVGLLTKWTNHSVALRVGGTSIHIYRLRYSNDLKAQFSLVTDHQVKGFKPTKADFLFNPLYCNPGVWTALIFDKNARR